MYVPCSSVGHQHGPHWMSRIEHAQQVAQLPQQGLEQLGLLVACSDYTEPPKTALVNWRNGLGIRLAATSLTVQ